MNWRDKGTPFSVHWTKHNQSKRTQEKKNTLIISARPNKKNCQRNKKKPLTNEREIWAGEQMPKIGRAMQSGDSREREKKSILCKKTSSLNSINNQDKNSSSLKILNKEEGLGYINWITVNSKEKNENGRAIIINAQVGEVCVAGNFTNFVKLRRDSFLSIILKHPTQSKRREKTSH